MASSAPNEELDERIYRTMTNRVQDYLHKISNDDDPIKQMQAEVLLTLLFSWEYEEKGMQAIYADMLKERLKESGFEEIPDIAFTTKVIGGIRNEGIIIAGTNKGYKLALSLEDIHDYLRHGHNIIEPMLARIIKARDAVRQDTVGKHDILDEYSVLKKLADTVGNHVLEKSLENEVEPAGEDSL